MARLNNATIGTVSHGTMRPEDLIPVFARELEWLSAYQRTDNETSLIADADDFNDFGSQHARRHSGSPFQRTRPARPIQLLLRRARR